MCMKEGRTDYRYMKEDRRTEGKKDHWYMKEQRKNYMKEDRRTEGRKEGRYQEEQNETDGAKEPAYLLSKFSNEYISTVLSQFF